MLLQVLVSFKPWNAYPAWWRLEPVVISRVNSICNLMKMQRDWVESSSVGCSCDVSSLPVCVCVCVCVCVSVCMRETENPVG